MNAAQIKHMKDAADIPNLLKNQNPGNKVHVLMQDVNTGEQHLVMYTVNEKLQSGEVSSGGVIAGGKSGKGFDMLTPVTFTGGEPSSPEVNQLPDNIDLNSDSNIGEEANKDDEEEIMEEDGISESAMKPKEDDELNSN